VVAAAADRFVPDPDFVVANVAQSIPDDTLRGLIAEWRARPAAEAPVLALAGAFIARARTSREPRYFGRAEALLAPRAQRAGASAALRRLYAETLQYRHAFVPAADLFDALLLENPRDADTRLRRASLRLTRGDFPGARADCLWLSTHAALASAGFSCLAEALAGMGDLARGRALLDMMAGDARSLDPAARAYLLATRAELRERAGDLAGAIGDYREASRLAPQDDAVRAAFADALSLNFSADAVQPLLVDNPSLALLVRRAALASGAARGALVKRAQDWLSLETARGDASHHREAAMLALADGRHAAALAEARRNFETQRELADVRVLARAVMSAGDAAARADLEQWLRATGYQDAVTENILAARPRS
jgi:tetratricopeptide (TPR) repeat protein